jgi:hypothetical protein
VRLGSAHSAARRPVRQFFSIPLDSALGANLYGVVMKPVTTGELAKRTGTTRKALRIYEGAGLLKPTRRTAAGYRMYGAEAVELVRFIVKARSIGLSVSDIRTVVGIRRSGGLPAVTCAS